MADRRRVTATAKDEDGDIQALCGSWGRVERKWAVRPIKEGTYEYFVRDKEGAEATVHVYADAFLRTDPNSSCKDNLDKLPDC